MLCNEISELDKKGFKKSLKKLTSTKLIGKRKEKKKKSYRSTQMKREEEPEQVASAVVLGQTGRRPSQFQIFNETAVQMCPDKRLVQKYRRLFIHTRG